jgi:hypothetical protein
MMDHEDAHQAILDNLQEIKVQLSLLQSNGGFSITFQNKRIKFAGSLPFQIKPIYLVIIVASLSGNAAGLVTKLLGAW